MPPVNTGTEELGPVARSIIDASDTMVVLTDRAGTILYVNPAFTATTGYSVEEALGQTPQLLRSGVQDDAFYRDLWGTVLSGRTWHGELVNRRKDGVLYTDEMTIVPLTGPDSSRFVALKRDISSRVQSLTMGSPTGLAHAARDGRLLYVNQRTVALFGASFSELIGFGWFRQLDPADQVRVLAAIGQTYDLDDEDTSPEVRFRLRNGRHVALRAGALTGHAGDRLGVVLALVDMTAETEAFNQLAERERFVRGILDAIADPTAVVGSDGVILDVNTAWRRFAEENGGTACGTGANYLDVCGRAAATGCTGAGEALEGIRAVLSGTLPRFEMEYPCDSPDESRWFVEQVTPLPGFGAAVVIHLDITWRRQAEEQLAYLAAHDGLTGLFNRSSLDGALGEAIAGAATRSLTPAVLFIDLDGFKAANDEFGHAAGDAILSEAADRLQRLVRSGDVVIRAGGDEFVVILADASPEVAALVAQRIELALSANYGVGPDTVRIGASVGVAAVSGTDSPAGVLARADAAMYAVKHRHHHLERRRRA